MLPLLLGLSVPAIAHNEFNGGCGVHHDCQGFRQVAEDPKPDSEEGKDIKNWNKLGEDAECVGLFCE